MTLDYTLTVPVVAEQLREIVREVAAELRIPAAELRYEDVDPTSDVGGCFYVRRNKPACLIGQWVHRRGVALDDLRKCEKQSVSRVFERFVPETPHLVILYLSRVQMAQDDGLPWMDAIDRARDRMALDSWGW